MMAEASEYRDEGSQSKVTADLNPQGEASEHGSADLEEGVSSKETEQDIFENLKYDYKKAKEAKTEIDDNIAEWNDLYEGKPFGKELKTRSAIVMKDIAKQLEWQKPNLIEPFTASPRPAQVAPLNANSARTAKMAEMYINYIFTQAFPRYKFMSDIADVFGREGTVWVRTGWEFQEETETRTIELSYEEAAQLPDEPTNVEDIDGVTARFTYTRTKVVKNQPTAVICKNEDVFPDPAADSEDKLNFICYRYEETLGSLRESGLYRKEALDKIEGRITRSWEDSGLGSQRYADLRGYGKDEEYQSKNPVMQRVTVIEYWGYYDMDGDGIPEPIVATWSDKFDVLLRLEENPLPGKRIPFHSAPYANKPFSLWGNAMAYFLADNQKVRSSIMRGIIDNMSLANNGQKFMQRGALDYVQFKRMTEGQRYIQTNLNPKEAIVDGSFNQLPPSVFNVMTMITEETEQLSGVRSGGPALDTVSQNKTASGVATQTTMSQQRMADAVRNLSALMKSIFEDWLVYAKEFLTPEQMVTMFGQQAAVSAQDLQGDVNVTVRVTTEMNKQTQIQQLNLMLQQAQTLGQSLPPQLLNQIVAEMMELFDKPHIADAIREYQPQPDPMAVQMQQLEMAKLQAEIQKLQAEAQAEIMYKQAQSREKLAKADATDMQTITKPQEFATETALKDKQMMLDLFQSMISGGEDKSADNPR